MSHIYSKLEKTIGNTPLVRLKAVEEELGLCARLVAKVEAFNPAGSVKDRVALAMIETAELDGRLKKGHVIIEPTSGNTGIGLAAVGKARGYKVILTMPNTMSMERRNLLTAYGAQLVLTDGALGMKGAIEKATQMAKETENSFIPGQFDNPANPKAHSESTGPEIWKDSEGRVDILVAGVGTGGTISGTGAYLKSKNPDIQVIAVEPAASAVLSGKPAGAHKIQGIGAGFIPRNFNASICSGVIGVEDDDAINTAKLLAEKEGILAGISSGAALWASIQLAQMEENSGKSIVCILPDSGERYLSTGVFAAESESAF